MDKRKKLPLPAGNAAKVTGAGRKVVTALCLIGLAALAAYFLLGRGGEVNSTRAFLSGSTLEIKTMGSGRIEYIARAGQPVSAGEVVFKMESAGYEKAAKEAETIVSERAGAIPQRSRNLMLRYLAIPQSEAELSEAIGRATQAEKSLKETFGELGERQAAFNLELRRLELKRERLPEEEARLEAMRVEEDLFAASLKEAEEHFETASLERAALERQYQLKRDLAAALRSLPGQQREQLYALEKEFYKMYEAERLIAEASQASAKSGRVIYTAFTAGDPVKAGETVLYILPDSAAEIWVTAYFNERAAQKMQLGTPCSINIDGADGLFAGIISERLPYIAQEPNSDLPFKVRFKNPDPERLIGIDPRRGVSVSVP